MASTTHTEKSSEPVRYSAPAAACAADVLISLGQGGAQSLSEIARMIGVSKSLAFRVLKELEARELVTRSEDGRIRLGVAALELAGSYLLSSGLEAVARDALRDLARRAGDTADLALLRGSQILYVMKEDGPHAYPTISHVGKKLPANCSALGKVLLSRLDDHDIINRFLGAYPRLTPNSAGSWEELLPMLEEARRVDYAVNVGEAIAGRCYVATSVDLGSEWAAIGVSANESEFAQNREQLIGLLWETRERVSRELAARSHLQAGYPTSTDKAHDPVGADLSRM